MPVVSNSKLTPAEKMILRDYRETQPGTVMYRNMTTTIVAKFNSQLVRFATSVRSPDEKKFRNKVGEFHARTRFEHGEVSILTRYDFDMLVENADFSEVPAKVK